MKALKSIFIFLFLAGCFHLASAQSFTKGTLRMGVDKFLLNGEEAPSEMGAAMGNVEIKIFSDGARQRTSFSMMMMKTETFVEPKIDSVFIYMDMMGSKYLIADSRKGISATNSSTGNEAMKDMRIVEHPEDTKEILGYKCHRVDLIMKMPEGKSSAENSKDLTMVLYITDKLNFDASYIMQNKQSVQLKGTPLEYTMKMGEGSFQLEMVMTAKEFKPEVQASDVDQPSGKYKRYTMDSFQSEMAHMRH